VAAGAIITEAPGPDGEVLTKLLLGFVVFCAVVLASCLLALMAGRGSRKALVSLVPVVSVQVLLVGLYVRVEPAIPFVFLYGCAYLVGRVSRHKRQPEGFVPRDAMNSSPL
jgi:hypothetical protein